MPTACRSLRRRSDFGILCRTLPSCCPHACCTEKLRWGYGYHPPPGLVISLYLSGYSVKWPTGSVKGTALSPTPYPTKPAKACNNLGADP